MRSVVILGCVILISTLYLYCLSSYLPPVPRFITQNRIETDENPGGVRDDAQREMIRSEHSDLHTVLHLIKLMSINSLYIYVRVIM